MPMTEATRLREPMMRVPVFKEAHEQQFGSFGRATILKMYLKLLEGIQLKGAIREAFAFQKCSFLTLFKRPLFWLHADVQTRPNTCDNT